MNKYSKKAFIEKIKFNKDIKMKFKKDLKIKYNKDKK
jgi:hypothetical protein